MPPFNPRIGNCWTWPTNGSKPTLSGNASGTYTTMPGQPIGYLRWVLYAYCGNTTLRPAANPGPWTYAPCNTAVQNFQAFFGLTVDGIVGPQTWGVIDYVYALNH